MFLFEAEFPVTLTESAQIADLSSVISCVLHVNSCLVWSSWGDLRLHIRQGPRSVSIPRDWSSHQ